MTDKQCKWWCLTLHFRSIFGGELDEHFLVDDVKKCLGNGNVKSWIFQFEEGVENKSEDEDGYLHYQVWLEMKTKTRVGGVRKLFPDWVIKFCAPSRGPAAEDYSIKSETRVAGPWCFPYRYMGEDIINNLKPWQADIVKVIEGPVDPRKIYWVWEDKGGVGKSALCKYLVWHFKARLVGGKSADALFAAVDGYNVEKPIYVIDIPRSNGSNAPYAAIEMLKNGMGFSSKYESKMFMGPAAHIVVFANFSPESCEMSLDRWDIRYVGDGNMKVPEWAWDSDLLAEL